MTTLQWASHVKKKTLQSDTEVPTVMCRSLNAEAGNAATRALNAAVKARGVKNLLDGRHLARIWTAKALRLAGLVEARPEETIAQQPKLRSRQSQNMVDNNCRNTL